MNKKIKKELLYIIILYIIFVIIFKIIFFKENLLIITKTITAFFWLFILPGFFLLNFWRKNLRFIERFILSIPVNAAVFGVSSYYSGLLGLNLKYHVIFLPALFLIIISILYFIKKSDAKNGENN